MTIDEYKKKFIVLLWEMEREYGEARKVEIYRTKSELRLGKGIETVKIEF